MKGATLAALLGLWVAAASSRTSYSGHRVLRVLPEGEAQAAVLETIGKAGDWDFWTEVQPSSIMSSAMLDVR
jgi:hypothetical protein